MKLAFFGSPETAKEILEAIHKEFPVSLVVSQPDKPVGRKKILTPTPVSQFAAHHSISVQTPRRDVSTINIRDFDVAVVVAYGEILPKELLEQPKYGFINVHYSLLPQYRGASPVQEALVNGDTETGVTIMKMDEELDHGEIIKQKEVAIDLQDTTESLLKKLASAAKPLLLETIKYIEENNSLPESSEQDHSKATYCSRITKQDAFVEYSMIKGAIEQWSNGTIELHNKIRAYYPWPIVWTILPDGKRCKIISSHLNSSGDIHDALIIDQIQIEGKTKTSDQKLINQIFFEQSEK